MQSLSKKTTTPCASCKALNCRIKGMDCYNVHDASAQKYQLPAVNKIAHTASSLIDNGRAGKLGRIEEVIEFCKTQGYSRVGLAYCFGMKEMAMELCDKLREAKLTPLPVSCTSGAVREKEIDSTKTTETVSCNPAGQALVLNKLQPELVIEMGLCMGHDVIFHQTLEVPHTTILVKDRVYGHNPAKALATYKDKNRAFIESLDNTFAMKSPDWLQEQLDKNAPLTILDLRGPRAYEQGHIKGARNVALGDLPEIAIELNRHTSTVCVCNGSVQSAYAIMYLYSEGFLDVHNLSGGMSRWQKENRPETSS